MTPKIVELSVTIDSISTRYHTSAVNGIGPLCGIMSAEKQARFYKHLSNTRSLLSELLHELNWIGTMSDEVGV